MKMLEESFVEKVRNGFFYGKMGMVDIEMAGD